MKTVPLSSVDNTYSAKSYRVSFAIVLIVYCLLYGWILISSAFIPYVMDGNESYSSLLHAYNLYNFNIAKSIGLTDEAASPDPAAHPFVHTHQGNFPRLFAYFIYLLGARDIESQILVTTFTVGLASIVFGFVFFSRISGPFLALTVSVFLMTDYLLFAQWQVVTYRVWHGFFIFSSLLCAQGIGSQRRLRWAVLTVLTQMCLFYGELVFACFTAVMTGLYTAWAYRHNWKTVALGWGVQVGGAVIGLAIVASQVILYLGWEDFLQDVYLTFVARSYASDDPTLLQKLIEFFNAHNIVFWYNLKSPDAYKGFGNLLHSIFSFNFLIHTPFLTLVVFLIFGGWLAGVASSRTSRLQLGIPLDSDKEVKALVAFAFLVAFGFLIWLFKFAVEDVSLAGGTGFSLAMPLGRLFFLFMLGLLLVGYLTTVCVRQAWNAFPVDGTSPSAKVLLAGLYLCGVGGFVSFQGLLYEQKWRVVWSGALGSAHHWIMLAVVCVAVALGLLLIILTPARVLYRGDVEVKYTLPFFVAGFIAFLFVYKLAPGYVHSGYLERFAPLLVFHVDTLFATSLFILLSAGYTSYRKLKTACSLQKPTLVKAWGRQPALLLFGSLGLAGYFLLYWVSLQVGYVQLFPYDRFAFMKMLSEAPYRGSSFVVNTYAAPVFAFTGQWAYYDSEIGKGNLTLTPGGFTVQRDLRTLWFADRNVYPDYLKPEYFLCIESRSVHSVIQQLRFGAGATSGCGDVGIVKQASLNTMTSLRHRLVDRDNSPDNSWAVVKLDWDLPPFLEQLTSENGGTSVRLTVTKTSVGSVAIVTYHYRHQEGLPEGETQVRLVSVEPTSLGVARSAAPQQHVVIAEGIRQRRFLLPRQFEGYLQVTVSPATATKIGPQYASELVWVGVREP